VKASLRLRLAALMRGLLAANTSSGVLAPGSWICNSATRCVIMST